MSAELARLDLSLRRRGTLGYSAGLALYALLIVALYPSFRHDVTLDNFVKNASTAAALFGISGSLTSPSGWLNANLYASFLPLVLLLVTVGYGAYALAGQDEDRVLALLAVLPVRRRTLVVQKAAAMAVQATALSLAVFALVLTGPAFQLSFSVPHLAGITLTVLLLGLDFGLLALAVGAATGRRGAAIAVASSVAAASYLLSSLAPVVSWLRPARYASLFFWAVGDQQLSRGVSLGQVLVLLAAGGCALAVAIARFERLDLH